MTVCHASVLNHHADRQFVLGATKGHSGGHKTFGIPTGTTRNSNSPHLYPHNQAEMARARQGRNPALLIVEMETSASTPGGHNIALSVGRTFANARYNSLRTIGF